MNATLPAQVGRYKIKGEIGRGVLTIVYHGYDDQNQRDVAVKVLPRGLLLDPTYADFFRKTLEQIAAFTHPALVPVYDYGEASDQLYIVTPLMTGGSLKDRLARGPLPPEMCARLIAQVAPAIDSAHQQGLIHLSIQPANILFDDQGNVFIVDFSLAPLISHAEETNSVNINAPAYMSPEQALGLAPDPRSDIYAVGAVVFEMLTGRQPYLVGDAPVQIANAHIAEPVPDILKIRPDLPSGCGPLIYRAMAKKAADRYATAVELADALKQAIAAPPLPAPTPLPPAPEPTPELPPETGRPTRPSTRLWWIIVAVLLGLAIVSLILAFWPR